MDSYIGKVVLVTDSRSGLYIGTLTFFDPSSKSCVLRDSRRIWSYGGVLPISIIASNGICHFISKVSQLIPITALCDIVQVIPCSPEAAKSILQAPVWKN